MKKENGITLVSLILIIVIILILVGVSIYSGTEALDSTRLQGFYTQLEVVQKRVDQIAATNENYIDDLGNTIYLKEQGLDLTVEQMNNLQSILNTEGISGLDVSNFRYFTIEELKNKLQLSEMEYNLFLDFENRVVIAEEGIKIGDRRYHVLKTSTYFVEENANKNVGSIEFLDYDVIKYGETTYKVILEPSNSVGDIGGTGDLKYKKVTSSYWESSNILELILEKDVEYDILYEDTNKNSIQKVIKVELDSNEVPVVTEINNDKGEY